MDNNTQMFLTNMKNLSATITLTHDAPGSMTKKKSFWKYTPGRQMPLRQMMSETYSETLKNRQSESSYCNIIFKNVSFSFVHLCILLSWNVDYNLFCWNSYQWVIIITPHSQKIRLGPGIRLGCPQGPLKAQGKLRGKNHRPFVNTLKKFGGNVKKIFKFNLSVSSKFCTI